MFSLTDQGYETVASIRAALASPEELCCAVLEPVLLLLHSVASPARFPQTITASREASVESRCPSELDRSSRAHLALDEQSKRLCADIPAISMVLYNRWIKIVPAHASCGKQDKRELGATLWTQ